MSRPGPSLRLATAALLAALLGLLGLGAGGAGAYSTALPATGSVHVTSRLGQETILLSGMATFQWGDPYLSGGVLVVDTELTAMSLTGNSVTGPVSVVESSTGTSSGRNTGFSSTYAIPASSYIDVYIVATVPASPSPTIALHNDTPIHFVSPTVSRWPPGGATYTAMPNPCVPLLPAQPMQACLDNMSFTLGPVTAVGGVASLTGIAPVRRAGGGVPMGVVAAAAFVIAATGAGVWWRRRLRG